MDGLLKHVFDTRGVIETVLEAFLGHFGTFFEKRGVIERG